MEFSGTALEGAGSNPVDKDLSQRAVVIRGPYSNDRRMHIRSFKNVHHFVLQTFKPRIQCKLTNAANTDRQMNYLIPNFCFDTGELGQYMTDRLLEEIKRHTSGQAPNLVKVKRVAGKLSQFGINAPFIAGTSDQAATNSGCAMAIMLGQDLHKRMMTKKGKVKLDASAGGLPTVQTFTAASQTASSTGLVTGTQGCNNWEAIGRMALPAIPAQTVAGDIYVEPISSPSDSDFQYYEQIMTAPIPIAKTAKITGDYVSLPKMSPEMTEVDVTESQGTLFQWNEECDWLLSKPTAMLNNLGSGLTLELDHAQSLTFATNSLEHTPVNKKFVEKNPEYGNNPATAEYDSYIYTKEIGKKGNYIDTDPGKDSINQVETLPVFNLQMMTPPTKQSAAGQHVLMQVTLETEIDIEFSFDSVYGSMLYAGGEMIATANPQFVKLFTRSANSNYDLNSWHLQSQRWGNNAFYYP